eukprot:TRINITY_DN20681_c0_g1_i1.p1 TRINITY_DN20681_c0_g1~~TRINITY_DN20681_c0_g1_i1.p1  ORF type:complete len:133 (-),score=23.67 TRINITY_DN20681_c0_g1_i1:51-449(-)
MGGHQSHDTEGAHAEVGMKSVQQLKDEQYADLMQRMHTVLSAWEANRRSPEAALAEADQYMNRMISLGQVNASNVRAILDEGGITEEFRRRDERLFQDLKRLNYHEVPVFHGSAQKQPRTRQMSASGGVGCC